MRLGAFRGDCVVGVYVLGCQKLKYLIYSAKCDGICVRVKALRDLL